MTTRDWFQSIEIHGYNKEGDRLKHEPIKQKFKVNLHSNLNLNLNLNLN